MGTLNPNSIHFSEIEGRVIVLTGGASGIGAALTALLHSHGAHVVFGDINVATGKALEESLSPTKWVSNSDSKTAGETATATFVPCDVSEYADVYRLFRTALDKHGVVDHAVSLAGIVDNPAHSYFDPSLDVNNVGDHRGDTSTLSVNLLGSCSFARVAIPFLRHGRSDDKEDVKDRSLTFLSSVTGFRDAPGMFLYQTSKQSILGLMRSMRIEIYKRHKIRVNAVCPGMTESALTAGFIHLFRDNTSAFPAHYQTSEDVACHIVLVMLTRDMNGKSVYVEEGRGWDFEDGLAREMPHWLGEEPTRLSDENLKFIESLGGI